MVTKQAVRNRTKDNLAVALWAVALPCIVFAVDWILPYDLRRFGIQPRSIEGLLGILAAPFLHYNLRHLTANSGALFVLLLVSLTFSRRLTAQAVPIVILLGGGCVWVFGSPDSIHIGASGVVYGLIGFMLFAGFFRREWRAILLSLVIFFSYNGMLFMLFRFAPGISWSSHFFGFASGLLAAWATRGQRR